MTKNSLRNGQILLVIMENSQKLSKILMLTIELEKAFNDA